MTSPELRQESKTILDIMMPAFEDGIRVKDTDAVRPSNNTIDQAKADLEALIAEAYARGRDTMAFESIKALDNKQANLQRVVGHSAE